MENEKVELDEEQLEKVSGGVDGDKAYLKIHGYGNIWKGTCPVCHQYTYIGGNGKGQCMCGFCYSVWDG